MLREFRLPWLLICAATISFSILGVAPSLAQDADAIQDNKVEPNADASDAAAESKVVPRNPIPVEVRSERLKRRAGEQVAGDPRGRAVVLGMHIQEADNERAKVIEVAAASPAFDAGIREGDEIISFDGFKADTYREWIDGIRKLATDAPDGDTLPIILVRDGERLNLRLRLPVSRAPGLPQGPEVTLNQQGLPVQPGTPGAVVPNQPLPIGGGGGDNILIADAFGDEFDDPNGGTTQRAVAEIFRLSGPPRTTREGLRAGGVERSNTRVRSGQNLTVTNNTTTTGAQGARIGLAGFRNDTNGMFVMLDVGGLQPGNYIVGIDDPGVLAMGSNPTINRPANIGDARGVGNTQLPVSEPIEPPGSVGPHRNGVGPQNGVVPPSGLLPPNEQRGGRVRFPRQPIEPPGSVGPNQQGGNAPSGQAPAGNSSPPQGRLEQPAGRQPQIPPTVLAQVIDSSQTGASPSNQTPGAATTNTRPTRQAQPLDTAAPSQTNARGAAVTDQSRTADLRRDSTVRSGDQTIAGGTGVPGAGVGPTLRIGTLTVDQSGTGRMQQVVEAVQVQDVVGQAIAIYSQNAQQTQQTTVLPPNLDAAADPVAGQQPVTGQQPVVGQLRPDRTRVGQVPGAGAVPQQQSARPQGIANEPQNVNPMMPVAAGVIRLISDPLPSDGTGTTTDEVVPDQQTPINQQDGATPTTTDTIR